MTSKISTIHTVYFTREVDQTANRSLSTVYQNTTGRAMLVCATCSVPNGANFYGITDSSNPPGTTIMDWFAEHLNGRFITWMAALVLPGNFYEAFATPSGGSSASLRRWIEYS